MSQTPETATPTNLTDRLDAKEAAAFDEVAYDVARFMAQISIKYRGKEGMLANALCDSLGSYVAMVAVHPEDALKAICSRLQKTPWQEIKAAHFGYTKLGYQEPGPQTLRPQGAGTVNMGDPRIKR